MFAARILREFVPRPGRTLIERIFPVQHLAAVLVASALSACAVPFKEGVDALRAGTRQAATVDSAKIAPKFSYLRVTHSNGLAILGLNRVDPHPDGPILVWQSVAGEVLRIQNGRVIGASGLLTEWRDVRLPQLPRWSQVAASSEPVHWKRVRDVMPGYRYGVEDDLELKVASAPARSALREIDGETLTWFEEQVRRAGIGLVSSPDDLPPARYAVRMAGNTETVVYGEQCLSPNLCITWQRWSAEQQDALRDKLAGAKK